MTTQQCNELVTERLSWENCCALFIEVVTLNRGATADAKNDITHAKQEYQTQLHRAEKVNH